MLLELPQSALSLVVNFLVANHDRQNMRLTCDHLLNAFDFSNLKLHLKMPFRLSSIGVQSTLDQLQCFLDRCQQLTELKIDSRFEADCSAETTATIIESLQLPTSLLNLQIREHDIKHAYFLWRLRNLVTIKISDCFMLTDISAIQSCTVLQLLSLVRCVGLTDLSALSFCVGLQELSFQNLEKLEHLPPLESCIYLQTLCLSDSHRLQSLSGLQSCGCLINLKLEGCIRVKDISALESCTNLVELDLADCRSIKDFSLLQSCSKLQYLKLHGCYISTISYLASMSCLKHLDLSYCRNIDDISPLRHLSSLQNLCLNYTSVIDLGVLGECSSLRSLHISGCHKLDFKSARSVLSKKVQESVCFEYEGNSKRLVSDDDEADDDNMFCNGIWLDRVFNADDSWYYGAD